MTVTIAWWDLTEADVTIDALEQDLRTSIDAWYAVAGLRVKLWIADRANSRWGAVMWWDPLVPADQPLPPNRAAELIGRPPTCRTRFDVVATAEGTHCHPHHRPSGDNQTCTTMWSSTPSRVGRSTAIPSPCSSKPRTSPPT